MTVAFVELLAPGTRWIPGSDYSVSNNMSGVRAAHGLGHHVVVLARQPAAYDGTIRNLPDRWIECDTSSGKAVAAAAGSCDADLVLSWIDPFAKVAREAAVLLRMDRVADDDAMWALRTKAHARKALDAHGVPNARWSVQDTHRPAGRPPFPPPWVVKPIDGFSSIDTRRVDDMTELRQAIALHKQRRCYGNHLAFAKEMICEEELIGPLVSAEGMVVDGITEVWGHTDRVMSPKPYFIELSVAFSAQPLHPGLDTYVQDICDAIGYRNGPFHCEVILTQSGPVLVEMNARLAGAGIHHAIDIASGNNCAEDVLRGYLNIRRERPRPTRAACITHYVPDSGGTVSSVTGLRDARAVAGVRDVICRVLPGDVISVTHSNTDRICSVIAEGANREQARAIARQALKRVHIDIRSDTHG